MTKNISYISPYSKAIDFAKKHYFISPKDLAKVNSNRAYIDRLKYDGLIKPYHKNVYISNEYKEEPEFASFLYTCQRINKGVICLLSALEYHGITTQIPPSVWIATPYNFVEPSDFPFPLTVTRLNEYSLNSGVIEKNICGNTLRIFNAAKTVADCFKFRNKIGVDVAIEALRDGLNKKMFTVDEFYKYAKINRVHNVSTPYLETITQI